MSKAARGCRCDSHLLELVHHSLGKRIFRSYCNKVDRIRLAPLNDLYDRKDIALIHEMDECDE